MASRPARPVWVRLAPALIAIVPACLLLAWALGLFEYLSFAAMREQRGRLMEMAEAYPAAMLAAYFVIYAVGTIAMAPGVLFWGTLAGGLVFGLAAGASTALLAGSTGAIGLFLIARTSLGGLLRKWAGKWLGRVEEGFRADALSYMFAMRFLFVPYPIANAAPGLLGAKLGAFAVSTFFGLIPAVTAYAAIGEGLGASLDAGEQPDLLKLSLDLAPAMLALGVLALAPVAYKHLVRRRNPADTRRSEAAVATDKHIQAVQHRD